MYNGDPDARTKMYAWSLWDTLTHQTTKNVLLVELGSIGGGQMGVSHRVGENFYRAFWYQCGELIEATNRPHNGNLGAFQGPTNLFICMGNNGYRIVRTYLVKPYDDGSFYIQNNYAASFVGTTSTVQVEASGKGSRNYGYVYGSVSSLLHCGIIGNIYVVNHGLM